MKFVILAPLVIYLLAHPINAQSTPASLDAKLLNKSEALIKQFENFQTLTDGNRDILNNTTRAQKLSTSVARAIDNFPESDIKTNLATAAYYYELAARVSNGISSLEGGSFNCPNQRPGIYRTLCVDVLGMRREVLLGKARLHVRWAKADETLQRGGIVDADLRQEMRDQRDGDRELAKRAIASLKRLEGDVVVHASLGDFESERKITRVPFETFQQHLRETVIEVGRILSWLPRNRLHAEISNALSSYQDGAFWWERVYQPRVINAAQFVAESSRAPVDTGYLESVPYTVIINWRNAGRSLKRAEALLQ
nr:Unknown Function [uncultured bacterium]